MDTCTSQFEPHAYRFKVFLQRLGFCGDDDRGDHFDRRTPHLPRRVVVVGRVAIVAESERVPE